MSKKYGKVYGNDSQNQSDLDAGEGYPHPQLQARPQQNYPVNILEGPGYKLFEAQSQVSNWRKYVNIFGWICIVYGSLGVFLNLIALMFIDVKDFEVRGPKTVQEFDYPIGPQIVEKILDAIASLSIVMLGLSCRKIANLNPTRESTWQLCKRAMYITALQILILIIRLFGAFIAMSMVIQQWESKSNLEAGNYEIINKETKEVFRYYKPRSSSLKGEMIEKEEKDQAGAFFFMSIFASFAIACCCLSICCACTIGGLYKFHITTKELELIQDLPSVRDINLNRQVASGVPVYQYRPDPSTSIARGQVLMVPNIQS